MKYLAILFALIGSVAHSADLPRFLPPAEADIPKNAFGDMVRRGQQLFVDTQQLRGRYVGNGLNCVNCHLEQGRRPGSAPLWGAWPAYPAYRAKTGSVSTFEERIQGCFTYSMNGKAPPAGGPELTALATYAYWLAKGAPTGVDLPGRLYPKIAEPQGGYDIARGERVYVAKCAICHGADGAGQKVGDRYALPPLWGKDSFNWGAGMHRVNTAAGFIKANMPLGQGGSLSDQEAWDVAAFVDSHERPQDPRFSGDIQATRAKYHADDGVNFYGQTVNGRLLGQGMP
jgi:thiosulfate dehydrogenase